MAMPDMGKMVGPLPLGAWLAVVAGGLGVALYSRRNANADAPDSSTDARDTSVDPGVGTGGGAGWINLEPPASTGSVGKPTTNDEWEIAAERALVAVGYPALMVNQALRNFLNGAKLGIGEQAIVNQALILVGPTPQVLPQPDNPIPPATNPTPARKPYTYHTVRITETLPSIAASYKKPVADLWNANKKGITRLDGKPGFLTSYALHHGQVLVIPWVTPLYKG